ncbi:MAG: HD domain-containing protein, partial [Acidimicrobiia bacterium]|nr:HD domain-containing protein [Acidimicrobiia bacterium]
MAATWAQGRRRARLVAGVLVLAPAAAAIAAGFATGRLLGPGDGWTGGAVRVAAIGLAAIGAHLATMRLFRVLVPLAVLLRLALDFPERAPSRLTVALRANQAHRLRQRVEQGDHARHDPPPAVATDLLAAVARLTVHDRLTRGHAERVRALADVIGREMGLTASECNQLAWAALLHDVGKIGVPTALLNKPGQLTEAEMAALKRHPEIGDRLVRPIAVWLGAFAQVPLEHHERWDGQGYPAGLAGTEISLGARIVAVADTFDVMTSNRAYHKAGNVQTARAELVRGAGAQFDPDVVRAFLAAVVRPEHGRAAAT